MRRSPSPATTQDPGYVSRGGHKLAGALAAFPDLAVAGRHCLDAGASTGGFTDVLLRAGAAHVTAADVGYGQLAWSLRTDPRVTVLDRVNVRSPAAGAGRRPAPPPDLVTADLSFISLAWCCPPWPAARRRTRISSCWSSLSSRWARAVSARAGSCAILDCGPKRSPSVGQAAAGLGLGVRGRHGQPAARARPGTWSTSSGCGAERRRWTMRTCGGPSRKAPSEATR